MDLVEAFRTVGPMVDDRSRLALARVYEAATEVGKNLRSFNSADVEDVAGELVLTLVDLGPRGERALDPDSEGGVRGWLRVALRRRLLDRVRSRKREVLSANGDAPELVAEERLDEDDPVDLARAAEEVRAAQEQLYGDVLDGVCDGMRGTSGAVQRQAIDERRALADGKTTIEEIVEVESGMRRARMGQQAYKRARDVVVQRHRRAVQRLRQRVLDMRLAGELDDGRFTTLNLLLDSLRLYDEGASETDEESSK